MSRRGLAIATGCAGGVLAFLDTTIVNTAFPGIAASFTSSSAADLAWVLDAYFIVIAALLVPGAGSPTGSGAGACSWPASRCSPLPRPRVPRRRASKP